jgi:hypothetical protein
MTGSEDAIGCGNIPFWPRIAFSDDGFLAQILDILPDPQGYYIDNGQDYIHFISSTIQTPIAVQKSEGNKNVHKALASVRSSSEPTIFWRGIDCLTRIPLLLLGYFDLVGCITIFRQAELFHDTTFRRLLFFHY